MARPSLAPERRAQILAAVEECIVTHGLAGVTYQRVAQRAGVQPTLIPHYFGDKTALLAAAVDNTLETVTAMAEAWVNGTTGAARVERLLDFVFGGAIARSNVGILADQLMAAGHVDERVGDRVRAMYRTLHEIGADALADAYPEASRQQCDDVAYGLTCLGVAGTTFTGLGVWGDTPPPLREQGRTLIATLENRRD